MAGYRLKITRASRMSELVDRHHHGLAALGGSAAFLRSSAAGSSAGRRSARSQLQLDVRILEEGHALRQEAYQREREALQALAEERERRHKAELAALEAQMQAKLEALTQANGALLRDLDRANALLNLHGKQEPCEIRRPGDASLAHSSVLFLDGLSAATPWRPFTSRSRKGPSERARARLQFPARFSLLAVMNPCSCPPTNPRYDCHYSRRRPLL